MLVSVMRRDAEVERLAAVTGRVSAGARAKTMHQPWEIGERIGTQDFDID